MLLIQGYNTYFFFSFFFLGGGGGWKYESLFKATGVFRLVDKKFTGLREMNLEL